MSSNISPCNRQLCAQMRGLMTDGPLVQWGNRIANANPTELRQIVRELAPMARYKGEIDGQRGLTLSGQGQAKIFLEQTFKALFEQDFYRPFGEFLFPFANDQFAAKRVLASAWKGIDQLIKADPFIMQNERMVVLNIALQDCLTHEFEEFLGPKGRGAITSQAVNEKMGAMALNIQNIFMLKLLEMIEIEKGPEDVMAFLCMDTSASAIQKRERIADNVEEKINAGLLRFPIDEFKAFGSEQGITAAVAMFFMFRTGQSELDASKFHYVFHLAKEHPRPADLITEYFGLKEGDRRRLTRHDDQVVIAAIEFGQVRCFRDIVLLNP